MDCSWSRAGHALAARLLRDCVRALVAHRVRSIATVTRKLIARWWRTSAVGCCFGRSVARWRLADDLACLASAAGRWSNGVRRTMARDCAALVAAAWPYVARKIRGGASGRPPLRRSSGDVVMAVFF
ncbi:hypothetical protein F511_32099 [Dorcoceras hygrometricum]|uniref:Uncharacterized protein n=1 Tax=Dorcoceras hygrometricum TaxID=472368 RepID=A0A2Z7ABP0_9LAMI|nr:hypothetical protein F511_32099 [Dorcoceras hygrometricum]